MLKSFSFEKLLPLVLTLGLSALLEDFKRKVFIFKALIDVSRSRGQSQEEKYYA